MRGPPIEDRMKQNLSIGPPSACPDVSICLFAEALEKIVALVVDDDEGRKILDPDAAHGFHAEIREIDDFDLEDVFLRENGGGAADGSEVKPFVLGAGFA